MNHRHNNSPVSLSISISTQSKLDVSFVKSVQANLFALKAVPQKKNILPKCRHFSQILTLLTDSCRPNEHFTDLNAQTFFFTEFLVSNTQSMLECSAVNNHEMEIMLNSCLKQTLKLITTKPHIEGDHLWQVLDLILNPNQPYYQCNSHQQDQKESPIITEAQCITYNDKENRFTKNIRFYFFETLRKDIIYVKFLDTIYNLIKKSRLSLNAIVRICSIMNNISESFSKYITTKDIRKVNEAISDSLLETADFQNPKAILRELKTLLKKSLDLLEEKQKERDAFKLQIAIICLNSETLLIANNIISIFQMSQSLQLDKSLSKPACEQLLCSAFRKMFENKTSLYSPKLLSYMYERNLFMNAAELKILWNYLKELAISDIPLLQHILHNIFRGFPCSDLRILTRIINERIDKQGLKILDLMGERHYNNPILISVFQSILEDNDGISKEWLKDVFNKFKMSYPNSTRYKAPLDCIQSHILAASNNPSKFGHFRMMMLWAEEVLKTKSNHLISKLLEIYTCKNVLELFTVHLRFLPRIFDEYGLPCQIPKVEEKIDVLEHLLNNQLPEKPVLTCVILCKLWEIFVQQSMLPKEKTLFFQAITRVNNSKNRLCLPEGDMQKFFQMKIASDKMKVDLVSIEGAESCFISFFLAMNQKNLEDVWRTHDNIWHFTVKDAPDELEGFDVLFELTLSGNQQFLHFFSQVYDNIGHRHESDLSRITKRLVNRCFNCIQKNSADIISHKCLGALLIIQQIMDNCEGYGIRKLTPHFRLRKYHPIRLRVETEGLNEVKELEVVVESNNSIFGVLKAVARFLKICWDQIELFKLDSLKQKTFYHQLGKTLMDAEIEDGQLLFCCPREIPKIDLLCDHNEMNPRVEKTFRGLFEEYSDNGKMSLEQFVAFCNSKIHGPYPPLRNDILHISNFSHYNIDRNGYLTVDNFLQFCLSLCQKNPSYTWEVLYANKKRNDLKEKADIENQRSNKYCLATYIISSNLQHFQTLYSLLKSEELIAAQAWSLLTRLSTHSDLFRDILELKGVREIHDPSKRNWNLLLDFRFKYKLLYALNIVEYLMHYSLNNSKLMSIEDVRLMKYQKTWQADFVNYGGLDHLCQVFVLFQPEGFNAKTEAYNRAFDFVQAMRTKLTRRDQMIIGVKKDKTKSISKFVNLANQYV